MPTIRFRGNNNEGSEDIEDQADQEINPRRSKPKCPRTQKFSLAIAIPAFPFIAPVLLIEIAIAFSTSAWGNGFRGGNGLTHGGNGRRRRGNGGGRRDRF